MAAASLARVLLAVLTFACAVACKKKMPEPVPQPVGIEGANCYSSPCNPGLACTPTTRRCAKPDDPEIVAAKMAELERERSFLAKSGVDFEHPPHLEQPLPPPPPTAEAPAAGAGAPTAAAAAGAIRIVRIANEGKGAFVIAACRADERLLSGGCQLDENRVTNLPSFPTSESPTDTLGGRWNCGWREPTFGDIKLEAFALCQRI